MKRWSFLVLLTLTLACESHKEKEPVAEDGNTASVIKGTPIGEYVVSVFKDSKNHLWFGTLENGVARYDGTALRYFTTKDGLPSNRVVAIAEDAKGTLWFGTGQGVATYDGRSFSNFSEADGLVSNMVSTLFFDANNLLWIGTWSGVSTFDGTTFKRFPLPKPTVTTPLNPDTQNWITHITADRHNHIWIARDGYGATKYNGKDFSFFLKKNGLHSNHITDILEDRKGTLWFASRVAERDHPDPEKRSGAGGVTTFDGTNYGHFPEIESFNSGDVYELYEAPSGDLWISTVANGVYHYDGKSFIHMPVPIAIMSMVEDAKGTLWLGGSGGLYKRTPDGVISEVTTYGPWN